MPWHSMSTCDRSSASSRLLKRPARNSDIREPLSDARTPLVDFFSILLEASLEFIPPAQAASEHECAVAGGDDDEAFLVVQPCDVFVDAECL
jgi:hypothetical protein